MRPGRGLIILAAVTLAAVVACGLAIDAGYREAALERPQGGSVFPALPDRMNAVAGLEVARASGRFVLSRREGGWANLGVGGYPADPARVDKVIGALARLEYLEPRTGRRKLHRKLEVEDVAADGRSTRLTVRDAAGAVLADVIVGKARDGGTGPGGPGLYVRLPGEDRAWLVKGSLDVRHDAADWSERTVVDVDGRALTALTVRHPDGETVALRRARPEDPKLTLEDLPAGAEVAHQYQIDYMAGLLRGLRFNDARPGGAADARAVPAFEVTAHTREHLAIIVHAGEPAPDGSVWVRIDAKVTDEVRATDRARREADRIRSRFRGWSLELPRTFTDRIGIRPGDIIGTGAGDR